PDPPTTTRDFPARGLSHPAKTLLTGFELGGNQTHLVDSGAAHDIDGAGDILKQDIVLALDEGDFLSPLLEDLFHARAELFPCGVFVVDLELAVFIHLH